MQAYVIGGGGLLGSTLLKTLADAGRPLGRDEASLDSLADQISATGGEDVVVFNCAAHTDLEAAERDPTADHRANAVLPGIIGAACAAAGARLVHFSSTGCYGGWKSEPYVEADDVRPTTAHHKHKILGEEAILASGCVSTIIRTGWLYGGSAAHVKNFVYKRMLEARQKPAMVSDNSQRGVPTLVDDLAKHAIDLAAQGQTGLFNVTAQGNASRFEYVEAIVKFADLPCVVEPGPAFARLAPISANEMAINARMQALGIDRMPHWRTALKDYVNRLGEAEA